MPRLGIVLHHGIDNGNELGGYGKIAEDTGFESIWVTERYFHEETYSILGYLAAKTQKIKLGLGVTNPYTRHPGLLAMATATLDRICGGRFVLGLGRSDKDVIQGAMGIPYLSPMSTLRETVNLLRTLLSDGEPSNPEPNIGFNNIRLSIKPIQTPPPIYLAAIGPKALRLAGAIADGVLLNTYSPVGYVKWAVQEVRQSAQQSGRDPNSIDISCMLPVRLTESPDVILPGLKQRLARLLTEPGIGKLLLDKGGFDSSVVESLQISIDNRTKFDSGDLINDDIVNALYIVGDPRTCKERIAEYREAGVNLPLLLPHLRDYRIVAETLSGY